MAILGISYGIFELECLFIHDPDFRKEGFLIHIS